MNARAWPPGDASEPDEASARDSLRSLAVDAAAVSLILAGFFIGGALVSAGALVWRLAAGSST